MEEWKKFTGNDGYYGDELYSIPIMSIITSEFFTHYALRITHHVSRFPVRPLLFFCLLVFSLLTGLIAFGNVDNSDAPASAEAEPGYLIRQITFEGNAYLNRKQLAQFIGVEAGQPYHKAEILAGLDGIIAEYRKNGFISATLHPEVVIISDDQVRIRLHINEGQQIRTGAITIDGNQLFSTRELQRELRLRKGTPFSQISLEQGVERILALYSEHGYPKVEIHPIDFLLFPDEGVVDFRLQMHEGNLVRISEVKLSGLKKTKAEVVRRELPIQAGEVFDQRKIDRSFHRLVNLGYFYEVSPALLEPGKGADEIIFNAHVTEAQTGRFSGVLGYAPPTSEFDNAPQLTGVIEASETNLLGTGRRANFGWKSGLLSTLQIGYEEPWAFGTPIKIGVEYSRVKQKDQFTEAESKEQATTLIIGTRFRSLFEGALAISYKRIDLPTLPAPFTPTNTTDAFSRSDASVQSQIDPRETPLNGVENFAHSEAQNGVKYGVTLSLTRDSRDYFLNPTRGRRDHVAFEFSRGDFKLRKLWLDLQQYFPTWRKQVIAIGLHGAAAWGANIPPTELFYLGGANTLRGYDEDWFSGPRRFHTNIEYRFLAGRTSQIFAFVDFGAVTQIDRPTKLEPIRVGYGFGMRLESKGGTLRMDYGLAEGSSALEGKIHVNLGTSF